MSKITRAQKGVIISLCGSVFNMALAAIKISIGLIAGSISVLIDGFNNFTDIFTSGATALGFGVAGMKSNEKYPHGYARIEYIISLLIAILVIVVGVGFLFSAIERILVPQPIGFSWVYFSFLVVTVIVKIAMGIFFNKSNKNINSMSLQALGLDSYQDAAITAFVLLTFSLSRITGLPIDALCAIAVAILIFINSGKLAAKSFNVLLGKVDEKLYSNIIDCINAELEPLAIEELRIHDYGHKRIYANVAVVFDEIKDLSATIALIKKAESCVFDTYKVKLRISIDLKSRKVQHEKGEKG